MDKDRMTKVNLVDNRPVVLPNSPKTGDWVVTKYGVGVVDYGGVIRYTDGKWDSLDECGSVRVLSKVEITYE